MTFGQQPQGGNTPNNNLNGQQPQYQYQYNAQQPQYGQSQYQQYGYAQNGTAAINTQAAYAYEEAQRVSVTRAYGEMTIGPTVSAILRLARPMNASSRRSHPLRNAATACSCRRAPNDSP